MQDLALRHEVLDRARDVFDRYLGVDSMLVEEIDAVGPEPYRTRSRIAVDNGRSLPSPPRIAAN
jgi:hypothetical protein